MTAPAPRGVLARCDLKVWALSRRLAVPHGGTASRHRFSRTHQDTVGLTYRPMPDFAPDGKCQVESGAHGKSVPDPPCVSWYSEII